MDQHDANTRFLDSMAISEAHRSLYRRLYELEERPEVLRVESGYTGSKEWVGPHFEIHTQEPFTSKETLQSYLQEVGLSELVLELDQWYLVIENPLTNILFPKGSPERSIQQTD